MMTAINVLSRKCNIRAWCDIKIHEKYVLISTKSKRLCV